MVVQSVTWVAHRVDRDGLTRARDFGIALGLEVLTDSGDKLVLQTARGDVLEYCGPDAEVPAHLFDGANVVVGYRVDDLDASVESLTERGFATIGDASASDGVRFQHVRGATGEVVALIEFR